MEFTDALFQVVQKLLPDHRVVRATDRDHHMSIDGSSATVEVTTFEPLQEILISWSVKVCPTNLTSSLKSCRGEVEPG